jgi:Lar family restriction alleviation protein
MPSNNLKPCPFCGGNGTIVLEDFYSTRENKEMTGYFGQCNSCYASLNYEHSMEEACEKWNTRNGN